MTLTDRREFLKRAGYSVAGLATLSGPLQGIFARGALAVGSTGVAPDNGGYGPLVAVPDQTDGVVRLRLPEGFEYRSFTPSLTPMSDGFLTPPRHDGMAAFSAGPGRYRLVRNHEVNGPVGAFGNVSKAYDPAAGGGTTTLEVNRHATKVESWVSCNGTQMNCAGGATPWGTWLTCEETVNGPDVGNDFTGMNNSLLQQKHGYVFEVPASWDAGEHQKPVPIRSAGRFPHEAVDIDPESGILYMTEDNFDFPSGFYRYTAPQNPMTTKRLTDGGTLEMLKIEGQDGAILDKGQTPGVTYDVEWVTIDDPDPTFAPGTTNNQALVAVGNQGRAQGAATFSRLEGIFYDSGKVYLVSTQGGDTPAGRGAPGRLRRRLRPAVGLRRARGHAHAAVRVAEPARCSSSRTTSASARASARCCARTGRPLRRTSCAGSRRRARSSTSRATRSRDARGRSSRARRSRRTARCCS